MKQTDRPASSMSTSNVVRGHFTFALFSPMLAASLKEVGHGRKSAVPEVLGEGSARNAESDRANSAGQLGLPGRPESPQRARDCVADRAGGDLPRRGAGEK